MVKTVHIVLGSPESDKLLISPEKIDRVVGVDRGALLALKETIRLDLAIGDFDSVTKDELKLIKERAHDYKQFEAEKDDTDAEIALLSANDLYNPEEIVVHNWAGGRMDHLLNLLFLVHQPRFQAISHKVTFKNELNTITFFKKGNYTLVKEKEKYYVGFIGMTKLKGLTIKDVKYPVSQLDTEYPVTLVSNEIIGNTCQFSLEDGLLAVIQSAK